MPRTHRRPALEVGDHVVFPRGGVLRGIGPATELIVTKRRPDGSVDVATFDPDPEPGFKPARARGIPADKFIRLEP